MSESVVSVCNKALGNARISQQIANLNETSKHARACKKWYEHSRDYVLSELQWGFATSYIELALVEEEPNTEWLFAYRYPQDCIALRKILNPAGRLSIGEVTDSVWPQSVVVAGADPYRIPYAEGMDSQGRLIYTDQPDAVIEITAVVTNPALFTVGFVDVLAWCIAKKILPEVTEGDQEVTVDDAERQYQIALSVAAAKARNEVQKDRDPESEFIRVRY